MADVTGAAIERGERKRLISVVVPVYNEEGTILPFYERIQPTLAALAADNDFEILFTNNRSTDGTLAQVLALRERDPRVQVITFSRNCGYQSSVYAGLRQATGDAILIIDVDCEDPPELLPTFVAELDRGADVVYGERDRREEPTIVTWARKLFYRVNRLVADSDIILDMAEFCLMRADVRDAVVSQVSTFPFLRAEIAHYGFTRQGVRYDRQQRVAGQTHYNLGGMFRFAVAGILSSSTAPLRVVVYALAPCLALDLGLLIADVLHVPWAFHALVAVVLAYLSTGIAALALYQARTYRNVIARPLAVIDWSKSATNTPREHSPNALRRLWREASGG